MTPGTMFSAASFRYPSHLRVLADEDLMDHIDGGDARVFETIFDRHAAAAWLLAYRICGRRAMADDIVQEAFLSLWRSSASYDRARGSVGSWVLCVVHHRAVDALRRSLLRDGRHVFDQSIGERTPSPELTETEFVRREDARQVREALQELPAEQSQAIELAYFGGLTHSQIAQMLKLPAGTVKGRIRLGLEKLRAVLERESAWTLPAAQAARPGSTGSSERRVAS